MLDGHVPYAIVPGNHDIGPNGRAGTRDTLLNEFFPVSGFESLPSFGGVFEEDRIDNSFHVFETGAGLWLVIALEFGPREEVVRWASRIVDEHADLPTIVVTHAYLYSDNTRQSYDDRPDQHWNPHEYGVAELPGGVHDGEELWNGLIRDHGNIVFVLSGHVLNDGLGRLSSRRDDGSVVHEILANYQMNEEGGAGYLRIMGLDPASTTVTVRSYSPYLDMYKTDDQNEFTVEIDSRWARPH